jgi:hypothetical protein
LIISEEEIHKFIQLTNSRMNLIFPDTKKVATAGVTDNTMRGKLIKIQNQVLDRTASVCSQKNIPRNIKLILSFFFTSTM